MLLESVYLAIVGILTAVGITISRLTTGRALGPAGLYSSVWGLSLGLYHLNLIPWPELPSPAFRAVAISWVFFVVGSLIVWPLGQSHMRHTSSSRWTLHLDRFERGATWVGLIGMTAATVAMFQVVTRFGLGGWLFSPLETRHSLSLAGDSPVGGLIGTVGVGFIFAALALSGVYRGLGGRRRLPVIIGVLGAVVWAGAKLGRWQLLLALLVFLSAYLYARFVAGERRLYPPGAPRYGVPLTVAGLLVGTAVATSIFMGRLGPGFIAAVDSPYLAPVYTGVERLTGPLQAFSVVLEQKSPHLGGRTLFWRAYEVFGEVLLGRPVGEYPSIRMGVNPLLPQFGERFRPATYLADAYWDFGKAGFVLVPLLFGAIATILYRLRSALSAVLLAFVLPAIVLSPSAWHLGTGFIIVAAGIAVAVTIVALHPRRLTGVSTVNQRTHYFDEG